MEDPNINIIGMNVHYLELVTFLKDVTDNLNSFITGESRPFPYVLIKNDVLYRALIKDSDVDADCMPILGTILPAMAKITQHLYANHLPGGRYDVANVTAEMHKETQGSAKHKFCETIFANFDQLLRTRPHISMIVAEASIMFTYYNKTLQWLDAKSEQEERQIFKASRGEVETVKEELKEG